MGFENDPGVLTAPVTVGSGDEQHLFTATSGSLIDARTGYNGAPDTNAVPAVKVTRTTAFPAGSLPGSAPEQMSAIYGIHRSNDPGAYQPVGVMGVAQQASNQSTRVGASSTIVVVSGGTGYAVNDVLDVVGGLGVAQATELQVLTVDGSGAVLTAGLLDPGSYSTAPTNPVSVTGGAGSGATFNLTYSQIATVDCLGVYGGGRAYVSNAAITSYGGFFYGRNFGVSQITSVEIQSQNYGASSSYAANGNFAVRGLRIHAVGLYQSACGININRTTAGQLWDVGIGFTQSASGQSCATACISIDCDVNIAGAGSAITMTGKYGTAAVGIADGNVSGTVNSPVLIGTTSRNGSEANAYFVVRSSNSSTVDPMIYLGSNSGTNNHYVVLRNGSGIHSMFVSGGSNNFITGSAAGDAGWKITTGAAAFIVGGSAATLRVTQDNKLGFYAHAVAAQQTVTGSRGGNAALASLLTALAGNGLIVDGSSA